jgi:hypothetical protein
MKYNRAFIIHNETSIPLLTDVDIYEDSHYWLFDSKESFHGLHDNENFYFKDSRIDGRLKLPLFCVQLEFTEVEE